MNSGDPPAAPGGQAASPSLTEELKLEICLGAHDYVTSAESRFKTRQLGFCFKTLKFLPPHIKKKKVNTKLYSHYWHN